MEQMKRLKQNLLATSILLSAATYGGSNASHGTTNASECDHRQQVDDREAVLC